MFYVTLRISLHLYVRYSVLNVHFIHMYPVFCIVDLMSVAYMDTSFVLLVPWLYFSLSVYNGDFLRFMWDTGLRWTPIRT